MNVLIIQISLEHNRILRNVSEYAKFELGVIGGNKLIAFFWNKGFSNAASQFGADRDILQIWIGGTEPASCCYGLIETTVNAAVGADHFWKSIRVCRLQFIEFTIINNKFRDVIGFREFVKNIAASGHLSGRGFP